MPTTYMTRKDRNSSADGCCSGTFVGCLCWIVIIIILISIFG